MVPFSIIKNEILNMDYSPYKIKTYIVFIPVISLIVKKIQMNNISHLIKTIPNLETVEEYNLKQKKFEQLSKWHYFGSSAQIVFSVGAIATFIAMSSLVTAYFVFLASIPIFTALYEWVDSFNGITTACLYYEFDSNGEVKRMWTKNSMDTLTKGIHGDRDKIGLQRYKDEKRQMLNEIKLYEYHIQQMQKQ